MKIDHELEKFKLVYGAANPAILSLIPNSTRKILDIGCGSGELGRELKSRMSCEVVGITYSQAEAEAASDHLDYVIVEDLNNLDPANIDVNFKDFDLIVCSHILEHLYYPQILLERLHKLCEPECKLIIALPNALNFRQRIRFLRGDFKYTEGGLMDQTHFRFFDWDTSFDLLKNSGYNVVYRKADGYFPLPGLRRLIQPIALQIDKLAVQLMPGLFGTQFILMAHP